MYQYEIYSKCVIGKIGSTVRLVSKMYIQKKSFLFYNISFVCVLELIQAVELRCFKLVKSFSQSSVLIWILYSLYFVWEEYIKYFEKPTSRLLSFEIISKNKYYTSSDLLINSGKNVLLLYSAIFNTQTWQLFTNEIHISLIQYYQHWKYQYVYIYIVSYNYFKNLKFLH